MENKGYTLIEMLVAMAIFSILIVTVMNTFMRGFYYQKRIVEMQALQREEAYLTETMSRELRMAKDINPSQQGLNGATRLDFTNNEPAAMYYCLANADGGCSSTGKFFSIKGNVVNSTEIEVEGLKFYTSQNFASKQPLVTVVLQLKSKKMPEVKTQLQTSVAMRLYN
jgi:prepilin-type N-terminal cleavage/methylation domain-containing protein